MTDIRKRVSKDNKVINLAQLDKETGGFGLSSSETEIVVVEGSPVTEELLRSAIKAHIAVVPLSLTKIIADAVQALPNPSTDLSGFKSGLIDIFTKIVPVDIEPNKGRK